MITLSSEIVATVMPLFSKSWVSSTWLMFGSSTHAESGVHVAVHGLLAFSL
jgi:hypothetical protein